MADKMDALLEAMAKQNDMMMTMMQGMAGGQQAQKPDLSLDRDFLRKSMDEGVFDKMDSFFQRQSEDMFGKFSAQLEAIKKENEQLKAQVTGTTGQLKSGMFGIQADDDFDKVHVQEGLPFTWAEVRKAAVDGMSKESADKYNQALAAWRASKAGDQAPNSSQARGGSPEPAAGDDKDAAAYLAKRNAAMVDMANGGMTRDDFNKQFGGMKAAA
jgi:hypothetical protein